MIKRCRAAPFEWEGGGARRVCAPGGGGVLEDEQGRGARNGGVKRNFITRWQIGSGSGGRRTLQRSEALFSCAGIESGLSGLMEPQ